MQVGNAIAVLYRQFTLYVMLYAKVACRSPGWRLRENLEQRSFTEQRVDLGCGDQ